MICSMASEYLTIVFDFCVLFLGFLIKKVVDPLVNLINK